jgi:WD40 repeat protein
MRTRLLALALLLAFVPAGRAQAQFFPYFGKNKVKYDTFAWRVYKSPHFEIYYYPEFEQHLSRLSSYAESGYQKISSELKHEIPFAIPLVLYKTHSEFEQTNLVEGFVPEAALAFTEPVRNRMVVPIDEPPDRLQGLITHELTHVFEFDLIPRSLFQRSVPLWVDEGLADYLRGLWDPLDMMMIREGAVSDQVPKISRSQYEALSGREAYNYGHAAFEFIEARYGKEGIRQFLYTLRKNVIGGNLDDIYLQAFRVKPEEFDEAYDKWLKERFKPYRDKQRPSDYGKNLSPNPERTHYIQVFGFAAAPSGEMVAALTGNRADSEADIVLLSARDGTVLKNLTGGYTNRYEDIHININSQTIGRSISFDAKGDSVAFLARHGKGRSLFLVSVLSGDILKRLPIELDQVSSPCLTPDGRGALVSGLKEGVSDIYYVDLETGGLRNLTQDAFADSDPQISPDGTLVVYARRVSGHDKLYLFPLANPSKKMPLTFGIYDDETPAFSSDGSKLYYSSNEDGEVYNLRVLDLKTGAIDQYTDALGNNMAPAALTTKAGDRVAFISYSKGAFNLYAKDLVDPIRAVDQDVRVTAEAILDFEPDVTHRVVPENKRSKGLFEKLYLVGRPPLNVGVTSGGDFFGGSQVQLTDILGDQNFTFTALSVREFRTYQANYLNLGSRFQYGLSAFDSTRYFYSSPFQFTTGFSRQGAFATTRAFGASLVGQYPLDKLRRVEVSAGVYKLRQRYENAAVQQQAEAQAEAAGVAFYLNNGVLVPISIGLTQETTRFAQFGPLTGSTFRVSAETSVAGSLRRTSLDADMRKYLRLGSTSTLFALRARGFKSFGDNPEIFYFGGNQELRGYQYLSFAGNEGFFANAELRLPLIDVAATPIGLVGPLRGTVFFGVGGAKYKGQPDYTFSSKNEGVSYVNDPVFGQPVSGFHLVDGRASYGFGLQFFFLGYPMHFDWSKLTDLKVVSDKTEFSFWIGFDF